MSIAYNTGGGLPSLNEERARSDFYLENQVLAAPNAAIQINGDGCATFFVDLRGTFSATFVVEGSVDGNNFTTLPLYNPATQAKIVNLTTAGMWFGDVAGYKYIRLRCSAFTSGSATCCLRASKADSMMLAEPLPSTLAVTNTGAAGAAVTLTLPAAGVGLFHYLTHILIERYATALLTAAATPLVVTTTNLPGTLAFSFPADAAAQGVVSPKIVEPTTPLKSSTANTATTIVCPATPNVIWRVTAFYYVGA